ncbi:RHS repeat-associated core domain-containing protein [Shewanella sp. HL-SH2]|uniref:RHS repeat-associated core domain-containing protein n=1 Tax=Shewanella sp. HL-SH2 TaxID=3436238 RepID=UPI003EBC47D6
MNGRVSDYNLGRFMSVDPLIQAPTSTQSVNPYSYIMNNPLAGTDPTGYAGCAASRIKSVCDTTLSNWGGNGKADSAFFGGSKSGGSRSNGNSERAATPKVTTPELAAVGSLEGNAAKGAQGDSGTNKQEKNDQGTHSPKESNTTPKERKELEDKLSSINIKARVANKNGGFERRDDAAAWCSGQVKLAT